MAKKYYWLKLQKDFFKRHDIRIVENMPNGKDYVLFYMKLLVESISHEGRLRFSDTIPYDENMLSTITNTNIDVVRTATKIFCGLELMEILEDKTIFMTEVNTMIGADTEWAEKKRIYREKQKQIGQKEDMSDKSKSLELEKELDIDKTKQPKKADVVLKDNKIEEDFNKFYTLYPKHRAKPAALKAWKKHYKDLPTAEVLTGIIQAWEETEQWQKDNGQYIPLPASFLNAETWNDDIPEPWKDPVEVAKKAASCTEDVIWYECTCGKHKARTRALRDKCPVCGEYATAWKICRGKNYPGGLR